MRTCSSKQSQDELPLGSRMVSLMLSSMLSAMRPPFYRLLAETLWVFLCNRNITGGKPRETRFPVREQT